MQKKQQYISIPKHNKVLDSTQQEGCRVIHLKQTKLTDQEMMNEAAGQTEHTVGTYTMERESPVVETKHNTNTEKRKESHSTIWEIRKAKQ